MGARTTGSANPECDIQIEALPARHKTTTNVGEHMNPFKALALNRAAIRHVVESHRARNPRLFGSGLDEQDSDASDLDILIDPTPETTLMNVAASQVELQQILGVPVDVLTPKALPDTFRSPVLSEAIPV